MADLDDYRAVVDGIRAARMAEAMRDACPELLLADVLVVIGAEQREIDAVAWERAGFEE